MQTLQFSRPRHFFWSTTSAQRLPGAAPAAGSRAAVERARVAGTPAAPATPRPTTSRKVRRFSFMSAPPLLLVAVPAEGFHPGVGVAAVAELVRLGVAAEARAGEAAGVLPAVARDIDPVGAA